MTYFLLEIFSLLLTGFCFHIVKLWYQYCQFLLVTARVRSTKGGLLSVSPPSCKGYPSPTHNTSTDPMSFLGGTPVTGPRSLLMGIPVQGGGTLSPPARSRWVTPSQGWSITQPGQDWVLPSSENNMGCPLPPLPQDRTAEEYLLRGGRHASNHNISSNVNLTLYNDINSIYFFNIIFFRMGQLKLVLSEHIRYDKNGLLLFRKSFNDSKKVKNSPWSVVALPSVGFLWIESGGRFHRKLQK